MRSKEKKRDLTSEEKTFYSFLAQKTTSYGISSVLFMGSIMRSSIPDAIKNNQKPVSFKAETCSGKIAIEA